MLVLRWMRRSAQRLQQRRCPVRAVSMWKESETACVGLVASTNLLPGTEIYSEDQPIMHISNTEILVASDCEIALVAFAKYCWYLNTDQRSQIMQFSYKPTVLAASKFRQFGERHRFAFEDCVNDDGTVTARALSDTELEQFVKVALVMREHMFCASDGIYIYANLSKFAHSCQPNCVVNIAYPKCTVRTIAPVKAGEPLTVERGGPKLSRLPKHVRQLRYRNGKDVACTCPRCAPPGDDVAQFSCLDATCLGVHLLHQATKVNYEPQPKPILLPCNMCKQVPPPVLQDQMFKERDQQLDTINKLTVEACGGLTLDAGQQLDVIAKLAVEACGEKMKESALNLLHSLRPFNKSDYRQRGLTEQVTEINLRVSEKVLRTVPTAELSQEVNRDLHTMAINCLHATDRLAFFPNKHSVDCYFRACLVLMRAQGDDSVARRYIRKALRMQLLLHGRENDVNPQRASLDALLVHELTHGPREPPTTHECWYCREGPQYAQMADTMCHDKYNGALYCSRACQEAHVLVRMMAEHKWPRSV